MQLRFTSPSGIDIVGTNDLGRGILGPPLNNLLKGLRAAMQPNVQSIELVDVAKSAQAPVRRRLSERVAAGEV